MCVLPYNCSPRRIASVAHAGGCSRWPGSAAFAPGLGLAPAAVSPAAAPAGAAALAAEVRGALGRYGTWLQRREAEAAREQQRLHGHVVRADAAVKAAAVQLEKWVPYTACALGCFCQSCNAKLGYVVRWRGGQRGSG